MKQRFDSDSSVRLPVLSEDERTKRAKALHARFAAAAAKLRDGRNAVAMVAYQQALLFCTGFEFR